MPPGFERRDPEAFAPYIGSMAKLLPILLMLGFGLIMWKISAWSTGRSLRRNSRPLHNDQIDALLQRLAMPMQMESLVFWISRLSWPTGVAQEADECRSSCLSRSKEVSCVLVQRARL